MKERALAQLINPILPGTLGGKGNPTPLNGLSAAGKLVSGIADVLFIVAVIAAFLYLILGGVQWITASGDKSGLEAARNKITNAILGLVIVAAAWAVWILVGSFLGIDVTNLQFPTLN